MSETLIYISTWRIKECMLEDFKRFIREMVEIYRTNEPQLIAFNIFLNEEETEMTSIQVHPDADSMDFHMQVLERALGEEMSDWVGRADFIEPKHIEIYGTPSAGLLEADQPLVESGLARTVKPLHIAGFTRATPG